jgi:hypothetical protein
MRPSWARLAVQRPRTRTHVWRPQMGSKVRRGSTGRRCGGTPREGGAAGLHGKEVRRRSIQARVLLGGWVAGRGSRCGVQLDGVVGDWRLGQVLGGLVVVASWSWKELGHSWAEVGSGGKQAGRDGRAGPGQIRDKKWYPGPAQVTHRSNFLGPCPTQQLDKAWPSPGISGRAGPFGPGCPWPDMGLINARTQGFS